MWPGDNVRLRPQGGLQPRFWYTKLRMFTPCVNMKANIEPYECRNVGVRLGLTSTGPNPGSEGKTVRWTVFREAIPPKQGEMKRAGERAFRLCDEAGKAAPERKLKFSFLFVLWGCLCIILRCYPMWPGDNVRLRPQGGLQPHIWRAHRALHWSESG